MHLGGCKKNVATKPLSLYNNDIKYLQWIYTKNYIIIDSKIYRNNEELVSED